jgi:DNA repair protein RadA/Sms
MTLKEARDALRWIRERRGVKIDELAVDLGIVAAVASSFREKPIDPNTVVMGEAGLAGEVRAISQAELRLKDAAKLGSRAASCPLRTF